MYALGIHVDEESIRTYVAADMLDICIIEKKSMGGEPGFLPLVRPRRQFETLKTSSIYQSLPILVSSQSCHFHAGRKPTKERALLDILQNPGTKVHCAMRERMMELLCVVT